MIAQRLVRTLCPHCMTWREADEKQVFQHIHNEPLLQLPEAKGCDHCSHLGFNGRTAIYEIVPVDEPMRRLIHGNAAEYELENHARGIQVLFVTMVCAKYLQVKLHSKKYFA